MNYEFSLNKMAVVSIVVGCVLISLLVFGAGLVVGSQWLVGTSAANPDATAKNQEPDLPKEPVLDDKEAPPQKRTQPKNADETSAPAKDPAVTDPEAAGETAERKATDGEIKIIEEAAPDPANEGAESEPQYVTVQIGVFLDEKDASRMLKEIERKGYSPSFFSGQDAEARQWYAVRIGAYSDRQQAANAAANFTRQEKIKAVVRPLGSL